MELFRRDRIEPPRILAIDDVRLTAPPGAFDGIRSLYVELLGLEEVTAEAAGVLVLRGLPRSGPRLIVELLEQVADKPMRRQAVLQVKTLTPYADVLTERRIPFEWSSGWFFFDRRLGLLDPGGNWIELVASHVF